MEWGTDYLTLLAKIAGKALDILQVQNSDVARDRIRKYVDFEYIFGEITIAVSNKAIIMHTPLAGLTVGDIMQEHNIVNLPSGPSPLGLQIMSNTIIS
jgi:hypothetical protein